jgi:chorismate mutase
VTDAASDPVVRRFRDEISQIDAGIVEAVNRRLELVARLKRHKETHGLDFVDRAREDDILATLQEANRGPLTAAGVQELVIEILALTKRELSRR